MSTDTPNNGRLPISPQKRQQLQQWFEHGAKNTGQGNFDYATTMFLQCVKADPANKLYAQNFLGNLHRKYNNNRTGAKLAGVRGATLKGGMKKDSMKKNWDGVLSSGWDVLQLNPWDVFALTSMAEACAQMQYEDSQVIYLSAAVEVDIGNPDTNRLLARAFARQGEFDNAMGCWKRVLKIKPADEEAARAIATLTAEKTIHKGGYEGAKSSVEVMADKQAQAERQGQGGAVRMTPEEQLERQIKKDPTNISKYIELTDMHLRNEKYEHAEKVLTRALEASGGGDVSVRERLEDVQLKRARQQVMIAEKKAANDQSPESRELVQKMKDELNAREVEVYRGRSDRYPQNLAFKYELGVRLQRAKNYPEAIKSLQDARGDTKRKAAVLYALGGCFEAIKQYKLASSNYEEALKEVSERDEDQRKAILYRAGVLAMHLKEFPTAERHLTTLAGLDFGFKDVGERLDKLAQLLEDGGSP